MDLVILADAELDYAEIAKYYVDVGNYEGDYSLALRFENEILKAFDFIKEYPTATHCVLNTKARSYYLDKFPFSVVYEIKNDCVFILSIYDQRRNPKFIINRIKKTIS